MRRSKTSREERSRTVTDHERKTIDSFPRPSRARMDKIELKSITTNRKKRGFDKPETVDGRGVSTTFGLLLEQRERDGRVHLCC